MQQVLGIIAVVAAPSQKLALRRVVPVRALCRRRRRLVWVRVKTAKSLHLAPPPQMVALLLFCQGGLTPSFARRAGVRGAEAKAAAAAVLYLALRLQQLLLLLFPPPPPLFLAARGVPLQWQPMKD